MKTKEKTGIKGMYRIHIVNQDGTLAGDSGWKKNVVTNLGIANFLAGAMAGNAGSKQVAYMAIGTGGAPATDAVTLPGEVMASTQRVTVSKTYSSRTVSNGSGTQYFYATFAAGFITGAGSNISNVGLYAATTTNDTLFAGNTFNSSACASNQAVNATYQIQLG
jgi:hypothetical protein